jgi:hypothetical protein
LAIEFAPALRCGCTIVCTPRQVFQNKKYGLIPLPRCARRAAPWTWDGAPAHSYDSGTRMRRFGGCFARCYRRNMLLRPFRCKHPVSTAAFQKKSSKSHTPGECVFFLPRCAPQSPCASLVGVVVVLWLLWR